MHNSLSPWQAQTDDLHNDSAAVKRQSSREPESSYSRAHNKKRVIEIPADLQKYLTQTKHPYEKYSTLQESRERRLRLLLRRFTNQIQYGCRNSRCDVPTCLSYRKRHSYVPVRPYSDVAARALAWRCVEEYASGGRNIMRDSDVKHDRGRGHRGKTLLDAQPDGLCWNDPIIPWYQDARTHSEKKKDTQERHEREEQRRLQEQQRGKSQSSTPTSTDDDKPSEPHSQICDQPVKTQTNGVSPLEKAIKPDGTEKLPRRATEEDDTKESSNMDRDIVCNTSDANPESSDGPPKDTSSFTQILYSTKAVKEIEGLSLIKDGVSRTALYRTGSGLELPSRDSGVNVDEERTDSNDSKRFAAPVYAFRMLNNSVITWLVNATIHHRHSKVCIPDSLVEDSMSVSDLARQSLHYCLSDPLRLISTTRTWRDHLAVPGNSYGKCDSPKLQQAEASVDENHTKTEFLDRAKNDDLPSLDDALWAFNELSCIQSYSTILDSIFAALQHAYVLPSALEGKIHNDKISHLGGKSRKEFSASNSAERDEIPITSPSCQYLDDDQTATLCIVGLLSMINCGGRPFDRLESALKQSAPTIPYVDRLWCKEIGDAYSQAFVSPAFRQTNNSQHEFEYHASHIQTDVDDNAHLTRLLDSLADVISHRIALFETLKISKGKTVALKEDKNVVDLIVDRLQIIKESGPSEVKHTAWSLLDSMCIVLLKTWDRRSIIQRTSPVGGALQMLAGLFRHRVKLNIPADSFAFTFVAEAFDAAKMPLEWLAFREDSKQTHILSFAFLFDSAHLVKYFRAINIEIMRKSYEYASINYACTRHFMVVSRIPVYGGKEILSELRPHMVRYFVLTIRRQHMLEDAVDQIWRRQRQELMRPLKVSLGKSEGEDGLDHGGVQQEFFRVVFAEALDASYGMFTIDEHSRMTWFQPESLEPLYKFEALGILMSLAVYNAVTLPVTFPLAFYRKLLGLKVKTLDHIEDGWPELTKGLRILQNWTDGDVGDIIARTYEFSYRVFDADVTVNMDRVSRDAQWPPIERRKAKEKGKTATFKYPAEDDDPSSSYKGNLADRPTAMRRSSEGEASKSKSNSASGVDSEDTVPSSSGHSPISSFNEAPLVTNANRERYIKDYIYWLTNKSIAPQFEAFAKGFFACLDTTALSIFTPEALQAVVEGHTEIDIDGLQKATSYDDFQSTDQTIIDFWQVVRDMNPTQHRKLLEFVTACDRVPVNGISSVTFIIQKNGDGDDRLPSSSTCYGRLLLPKYSCKEVLRMKLEKAIENSVGFGSL